MRLQNRDQLLSSGDINVRAAALDILEAGLEAADPYQNVRRLMKREGNILYVGDPVFEATDDPRGGVSTYDLSSFRKVIITGAGKGIQRAVLGIEETLGEYLTGGHVIAKYGDELILSKVGVTFAAHPVPDENCVKGSLEILKLTEDITEDDLVITVIGNGASSLMTLPLEGISLEEVSALTEEMQIHKGVPTNELNTVRNHLDQLKGGKLSRRFLPAKMIHICVTDISRSDINGKPFDYEVFLKQNMWLHNLCDGTTYEEAEGILKQYDVWDHCSGNVKNVFIRKDPLLDTVKYEEFIKTDFRVFGVMPGKLHFIPVMKKKAEELGYPAYVMGERIMIQATEAAGYAAAVCKNIQDAGQPFRPPVVLLSTGEMVVAVGENGGVGGRNQEFSLAMAREITGRTGIAAVSCDSDGTDGPGGLSLLDAPSCLAGGLVDGSTWEKAKAEGLDPDRALRSHATSEILWKIGCGLHVEQNISINDLTVIVIDA